MNEEMIDASAIEYIPIAGDIASFAVDIIENQNEVWKTTRQKLEEDPENVDRYDVAVSKK